MALVKLRERAQITLPREVRAALKVDEGDYLDAEVVDDGVLLRPVAVADRDAARRRLREMLSGGSRYIGPDPEPSDDELMRMVVDDIEDARGRDREGGPR